MIHRDHSRRREPGSLPFYHGTLVSNSVASKMLVRESPGTFLLWRAVNSDQLFLSYKTVNTKTILHSKINFTDESNCFIEEAEVTSTSIRRLVENLKIKGVLTLGLKQLRRSPAFSPSNSFDSNDLETEAESSSIMNIPCISKEEAENSLAKAPPGTWILRNNGKGELRVSFVSSTKVKHKMLYKHEGELFTMTEEDTETPVSLVEILIKMKEQNMITNRFSKSSDVSY